jgi:hypothetical protein
LEKKLFSADTMAEGTLEEEKARDNDLLKVLGDGRDVKLKMCLYLEALLAAMEVGLAL